MSSKTVLVTGATGFIGGAVARRFRDAGFSTYALVRGAADRLREEGIRALSGDLEDLGSLSCLDEMPDPSVVCHLAADTRMDAPESEARKNVLQTENLLAGLGERLRGSRFLFASSIAAVDRRKRPKGPLTEEDEPHPRSPYAAVKLACEERIRDGAEKLGYHAAILRLATIYGRDMQRGGLLTLADAVREGRLAARLPWPGHISFCLVDDVAEVFYRLATRPENPHGTWFVAEDRGHTMAEAADMIREVTGGGKGRIGLLRPVLGVARRFIWLPVVRRFTPWSLRAALDDTILCDSGPVTRLLSMRWTSLSDGIRRTFG